MRKNVFIAGLILSIGLHFLIFNKKFQFSLNDNLSALFDQKQKEKINPLKIRRIGDENSKYKSSLPALSMDQVKIQKPQVRKKPSPQKLPAVTELAESPLQKSDPPDTKDGLLPEKAISKLKLSNSKIKSFLKSDNSMQAPAEILSAFAATSVNFDLVLPHGMTPDKLNQKEMVFYSFYQRTARAYFNSFVSELNSFRTSNPHLRFPLTSDKQEIAGRITYDKNGDILKIETLKYTQIARLQDFFMDVLKNMDAFPNPPKDFFTHKDYFTVNFVLTVNDTKTQ